MEVLNKVREEGKRTTNEIRARVGSYIIGGLGVVVGIAWNDAIRALIEYLFPLDKNSILMKFVYALILTLIVVIVTLYLMRFISKQEDKK